MWVDDYFHYKDWEDAMKDTFDSFNLLVVPRKENDYKFFYDAGSNKRIVPQGIFPDPTKKRELMKTIYDPYTYEMDKLGSPDELNQLK